MSHISLKLPANVVTVFVPPITSTLQLNDVKGSTRVTRSANRRVTRGGNVRVTHYSISGYPEVVNVKINNTILNVSVP